MKLGKETGSVMNWLMVNPGFHQPVVGENVTECMWTDRHAWRVTAVAPDGKGATLTQYAPKRSVDAPLSNNSSHHKIWDIIKNFNETGTNFLALIFL